jgi:hypothetical protein
MRDAFWVGVYSGMDNAMIDRMIGAVREGVNGVIDMLDRAKKNRIISRYGT